MPRASASKRFANAVSVSKRACVNTIQTCGTVIRYFPEFDLPDFTVIGHRGYSRVLRELRALQNRLYDCTKFDKLIRYRCANLSFLVLPKELFHDAEIPVGWGALVEFEGALKLMRKPNWHETALENRIRLLQRIAMAGTRAINRQLEIAFADVIVEGKR
jgi:hypothetical protein